MSSNFAIIPAGGIGKRFGGKKQFKTIGSKSILEITLNTFLETKLFDQVIVSLPKEDLDQLSFSSDIIKFVEGGSSRAESVYCGFKNLDSKDDDKILIHDGVRPLISNQLINSILNELDHYKVVIPGIDLADTIKEMDQNLVKNTIDRSKLKAIQTPQGFRGEILEEIYKNMDFKSPNWTDEAMLAESLDQEIKIIPGEKTNIKVTTLEDFKLAEFYLKEIKNEI